RTYCPSVSASHPAVVTTTINAQSRSTVMQPFPGMARKVAGGGLRVESAWEDQKRTPRPWGTGGLWGRRARGRAGGVWLYSLLAPGYFSFRRARGHRPG